MTTRSPSGHVQSPHTADLRIEAWAPTREECVAEAVHALVDSFADCPTEAATAPLEYVFHDRSAEDLLIAVLEEVIYLLDTTGRIPVRIDVCATSPRTGWRVRFAMADADAATLIGAVPKAVSLHGLRFTDGPGGWSCAVTIDV